ncbi:sulfur oxidation c-type cytochrome SoxA [Rhodobacteraceae bacterium N5(2021)]|uniref:SoxAX cytochrome complex subunit A n=1 Tax=Gymnodinialimonas phycosphaerae TaxID=2841589 RepID=A0A975YHJ4_9RHOB|nr:sulfur oxidation c-type cytochrome SoxA [Gymnodinialimonas phycosphaerae]MBY4892898.1 sulfur oxidation c-type cytochrome SoxA [Gymnodinialimonas phycosphaerae]
MAIKRKPLFVAGSAAIAAIVAATAAVSDIGDENILIVNGDIEMIVETDPPEFLEDVFDTIYSGWVFRSPGTQAMQADDFDNPAMLDVDLARDTFNTVMGTEGQSCASCHENPESLAGVRATYPQWDEEHGTVQTVEMQITECMTERMGAEAYGYDSGPMRQMSALISSVSRGMVIDVAMDGPAQSTWEQGEEIYYTRYGLLELSCANCHEQNYGNNIRADHLSQGQINGFPTYRLRNSRLNSVHGRFFGCIRDTRAESFAPGSDEFIALELYVATRGNGLTVEGPSVRN